jgi:hypothetical protein
VTPEFVLKQIAQPRFVLMIEETGNMNLRVSTQSKTKWMDIFLYTLSSIKGKSSMEQSNELCKAGRQGYNNHNVCMYDDHDDDTAEEWKN